MHLYLLNILGQKDIVVHDEIRCHHIYPISVNYEADSGHYNCRHDSHNSKIRIFIQIMKTACAVFYLARMP